MKKILLSLTVLVLGLLSVLLPVADVSAIAACNGNDSYICKTAPSDLTGGVLKNAISVLLYVAGTIAVIMIIIGAIRYITSDGDSSKASQARLTIIYAVVGLVVAIMSFGIVNFVIGRL